MGMYANQALLDLIFRMRQKIKDRKKQKKKEKEKKDR